MIRFSLADSFFSDANYFEAVLWGSMALIAFVVSVRQAASVRRRGLSLAVTLAAFSGSDVVEASTGAWWRPWWLLVWKGLCLLIFLLLWIDYLKRKRRNHIGQSPVTP